MGEERVLDVSNRVCQVHEFDQCPYFNLELLIERKGLWYFLSPDLRKVFLDDFILVFVLVSCDVILVKEHAELE